MFEISIWKFIEFGDLLFSFPRMQLDDLAKVCRQQLLDVVVVEENVVSLLDLCVLYEQMTGGAFLEMRAISLMR